MTLLRRDLDLCPTCVAWIDPTDVEIRTFDGRGATVATRRANLRDLQRKKSSLAALQTNEHPTCPNGHYIPPDYLGNYSTIALIGPTFAMKTHFLAAAIHQLIEGAERPEQRPGVTFRFAAYSPVQERLEAEYFSLVRPPHRILRRTTPETGGHPVRQPITLEVQRYSEMARHAFGGVKRRYLILFDAPGELITGSKAEQATIAPYLTRADGYLFFVDLLQVRPIRALLDGAVPSSLRDTDFPSGIVNSTALLAREKDGRSTARAVGRPALAVLAKADVLAHAGAPIADWLGTPPSGLASLSAEANRAVAERFAADARSGLRPVWAKLQQHYTLPHAHLASATGCAAVDGHFPFFDPWGCVDAIHRLLHEMRFLR